MSTSAPVTLAGSAVDIPCHACALFHNEEDEYRVLMPFLQEGLERGDRSFHIADGRRRDDHRRRLGTQVDVPRAEERGQLHVAPWEEAYLIGGYFDQERMFSLIRQVLDGGRERGYGTTRLWANMEWALEDVANVHQLVEYESRLNYILPGYHDVVVCTYDLSRFTAAVVVDIMRIHPIVIVGGIVHQNPFYVPPDQFLQELARRPPVKREACLGATTS